MHPPHGQAPCTGSWTFTAADQLGFVQATMLHLEQALASMTALGKTAIISTEVYGVSRSISPQLGPIRCRPLICTCAPWDVRVVTLSLMKSKKNTLVSLTKSKQIPTRKHVTAPFGGQVSRDSAPLNASVFDSMLRRNGAMHFNEFFAGSEDDIQTALAITRAGGLYMVHASGPTTVGPFSAREYCLAAFLIVAGEHSYWGMGHGWGVGSFPWYPEFDRTLGKPLGDASSPGPGLYVRAFEHLNVTLDSGKKIATINWPADEQHVPPNQTPN